jgi:hypothetical protein
MKPGKIFECHHIDFFKFFYYGYDNENANMFSGNKVFGS